MKFSNAISILALIISGVVAFFSWQSIDLAKKAISLNETIFLESTRPKIDLSCGYKIIQYVGPEKEISSFLVESISINNLKNLSIEIVSLGLCQGFKENMPDGVIYHKMFPLNSTISTSLVSGMSNVSFAVSATELIDVDKVINVKFDINRKYSFKEWFLLCGVFLKRENAVCRKNIRDENKEMTIEDFADYFENQDFLPWLKESARIYPNIERRNGSDTFPYVFCRLTTGDLYYTRRPGFDKAPPPPPPGVIVKREEYKDGWKMKNL